MKVKDSLAADYWINNTQQIYKENFHVSTPVMDAYSAGFEQALLLAAQAVNNSFYLGFVNGDKDTTITAIKNIGEQLLSDPNSWEVGE
jgi:hypothetical protein